MNLAELCEACVKGLALYGGIALVIFSVLLGIAWLIWG